MLSELVTDMCGQSKVYVRWKIAAGFLYEHQSPVYTVNVTLMKLLVGFHVAINLQCKTQYISLMLENIQLCDGCNLL